MRLAIVGSSVTRVCFDYALTIFTSSDYELRIETKSTIKVADKGPTSFEPEDPAAVASKLLSLVGMEVSEAMAIETGLLMLRFDMNAELLAEPHVEYEAWSLSGPGGERVVCMPGGELAIWKRASD